MYGKMSVASGTIATGALLAAGMHMMTWVIGAGFAVVLGGAHAVPASNHKGSEVIHRCAIAIAVPILGATAYMVARMAVNVVLISYWIFGAALIAICLLAFARGRKFVNFPIARGRTIAIIPAYNEPQEKLHACVRSLLAQTVKLDKIIVMDDGSAEPVVPFDAPGVEWVRQPNVGKRGAQVAALRRFRRDEFQFVMTVDSDSTPYPDALEHLLRAMSNRKVQAATGWIYVRNYQESLVARAADIDIGGSCVMMRASRSMLGALETTFRALALYRSEILYDHLDEYAVECGTGDDRWLAMRALLRGQVVGVYEAGVETDMPATLRGTFRQRLRWARSWWWMLPFAYARLNLKQLASPTVGLIELVITPLVMIWAVTAWVIGFRLRLSHPEAALAFVGAYAVIRIALSVLYLAGRPGMSSGRRCCQCWSAPRPRSCSTCCCSCRPGTTRWPGCTTTAGGRGQSRSRPGRREADRHDNHRGRGGTHRHGRGRPSDPGRLRPKPAEPAAGGYLGVAEAGETVSYQPVDDFAAAIGRKPNIVLYYSSWKEAFNARFAGQVHAHGATPFVQIDPGHTSLATIASGRDDAFVRSYARQGAGRVRASGDHRFRGRDER